MTVVHKLHQVIHAEAGFKLVAGRMQRLLDLADRDDASAAEVSAAILEHVSLTERVLSIANSASVSRGRHAASTVQAAFMLCGTIEVRRIAVAVLTYDGLKACATERAYWLPEFQAALLAGEIAKALAHKPGFALDDNCATAALLRGVSRILSAAVDLQAHEALATSARERNLSLEVIARHEHGVSLSSISQGALDAWQLPFSVRQRVAAVQRPVAELDGTYDAWCRAISACAYDIAETLHHSEAQRKVRFEAIVHDFSAVAPASVAKLTALFEDCVSATASTLAALGLPSVEAARKEQLEALAALKGGKTRPAAAAPEAAPEATSLETRAAPSGGSATAVAVNDALRDIAEALTRGSPLAEVFALCLDACVRGLRAEQGALVLLHPSGHRFVPVSARGLTDEQARALAVPARYGGDLISAVLAAAKDVVIEEPRRLRVRAPANVSKAFGEDTPFCLLPVHVDKEIAGFFFVAWGDGKPAELSQAEAVQCLQAVKAQLALGLQLAKARRGSSA